MKECLCCDIKKYRKNYYEKNKKKICLDSIKWQKSHRLQIKIWQKKWRDKNKDKTLAIFQRYDKSIKGRYRKYKDGAKTRNHNFNLSLDQFTTFWKKPCHYCGSKIETIGLDRVDNKKDYTMDNVVSCCIICNKRKGRSEVKRFLNKYNISVAI